MAIAEPLILEPSNESVTPAGYLSYFVDKTGELDIEDVRGVKFTPTDTIPNFGYRDSHYWYRIDIVNARDEAVEWLLRSGIRFMRPVQIFVDDGNDTTRILYNDETQSFNERTMRLRHLAAKIDLTARQQVTVYIQFRAGGTATFPFFFYQPEEMYRQDAYSLAFTSAMLAVLLSLVLVNFYNFLASRQAPYLLYCLQELSIALYLLHMDGYAFEYIWPNFPGFNAIASPLLGSASVGFSVLFAMLFLNTKEHVPRVNWTLRFLTLCAFVVALSAIFFDIRTTNQMSLGLAVLTICYLIVVSAYLYSRGVQTAGYYLLAWIVRLIGSIQFTWFFGGFEDSPPANALAILKISIILQAIIFSIGLAAQYRRLAAAHQKTHHNLVSSLRLRLEESRELAQVEFEKDSALMRVVEKSSVLANTSHDIAQPIRSLRLAFSSMKSDFKDARLSESVASTLDTMEDILKQTLDEASGALKEAADEVELNIETALSDIALRYQGEAIEKDLFIRVNSVNCNLRISPIALGRCLGNLVSNSIRNTKEGGILVSARRRANGFLIQVRDTGIGMTEEEVSDYSGGLKKSPESLGYGLGLAIVQEICLSRGWGLDIYSKQDRGTCISILVALDGA